MKRFKLTVDELTQNNDVELCAVWPDTVLGDDLVLAGDLSGGVLQGQPRERSVTFDAHIQAGLDLGVLGPPRGLRRRRADDVDADHQRFAGFDLLRVLERLAVFDHRPSCTSSTQHSFTRDSHCRRDTRSSAVADWPRDCVCRLQTINSIKYKGQSGTSSLSGSSW